MDTYLTVVSKRDLRSYAPEPLPDELIERILQAGRISGNAMNRQQRRFVVLSGPTREQGASLVTRPSNLERCSAAIAIVGKSSSWAGFDAGRAAQSMMLAAWSEGVGSCPNALRDRAAMCDLLGVAGDEGVFVVISFGYPAKPRDPETRQVHDWVAEADREPLAKLVSWI